MLGCFLSHAVLTHDLRLSLRGSSGRNVLSLANVCRMPRPRRPSPEPRSAPRPGPLLRVRVPFLTLSQSTSSEPLSGHLSYPGTRPGVPGTVGRQSAARLGYPGTRYPVPGYRMVLLRVSAQFSAKAGTSRKVRDFRTR
eukprot:1798932-Rhodomonas_salina.2